VATFTQLASGNWRVQVRRKTRYVAETFRRRKDGQEWALEMERNIDRNGSSKPRAVRNVRTFGDLIDPARRRHARGWKAPSPCHRQNIGVDVWADRQPPAKIGNTRTVSCVEDGACSDVAIVAEARAQTLDRARPAAPV
jgi:hypothetical protein